MRKVLIMGAAGRDFHNFHCVFRGREDVRVVAFTATQIPGIEARRYPPALAGAGYPEGIAIYPENRLAELIRDLDVDEVVFSYSDVPHQEVMHKASLALANGADFRLLGPRSTALTSRLPVIAICAVRTGVGKSPFTRKVAALLKAAGQRVAVVRHPMPYGDLERQRTQRFATLEDLRRHDCTIEEWEEYETHIENQTVVFAGVDYHEILAQVEQEADVILWDGGNNDLPFYRPDLHFTLVDPHRVGHETSYHPGEANLLAAGVIVVSKVDSASRQQLDQMRANVARANPEAVVIEGASEIRVDAPPEALAGKKVMVVDDGPTLTHGGMPYGAGYLAAQRYGCQVVDPHPFLVGSLRETYQQNPHLQWVVPAMGYSAAQRAELEETINASGAEAVLVGTPIDLTRVLSVQAPCFRVSYNFRQTAGPPLQDLVGELISRLPGAGPQADRK
jgi:predicted GTPase